MKNQVKVFVLVVVMMLVTLTTLTAQNVYSGNNLFMKYTKNGKTVTDQKKNGTEATIKITKNDVSFTIDLNDTDFLDVEGVVADYTIDSDGTQKIKFVAKQYLEKEDDEVKLSTVRGTIYKKNNTVVIDYKDSINSYELTFYINE